MKCDHIEDEQWLDYSGEPRRCYPAEKVDEAIAELKAKLAEKDEEIDKQKWRGDEWAKACNQKDKEIDSLKATAYADSVDAGMRERRLRRALWVARAERAKEMCQRLLIQGFDPKWEEVERKCLKKAEEYNV